MKWARSVFQWLPESAQRAVLRQYLVREICHGRRTAEGEMLCLPNLIRPGDVVWDIGANVGEYTFQLSRIVGPAGQVHAFEPLPYNFGTLLSTIRRAHLRNVIPHALALSDYNGRAHMNMPSVLSHSLATFTANGPEVMVHSIDDLIAAEVPRPSFIKCDVEGNGPAVIAGAAKLIRNSHPVWLLEVWSNDEIRNMESLGYNCYRYPVRGGTLHQVHAREGTSASYFFLPSP